MIVDIARGAITLREPYDFSHFHIRVAQDVSGWAERLEAAQAGTADGEDALISVEWVRAQRKPGNAEHWNAGLDAMLTVADHFGWLDEYKSSIRAHVEFDSESTIAPDFTTLLENLASTTLAARADITGGSGPRTVDAAELGIPTIVLLDATVGVASATRDEREKSLLVPSPTALAATWDLDVIQAVGGVIGREALERDVDIVLAPNLGIPRSPLSGRVFEMFSEDPFLTGLAASAWVEGVQTVGVGACLKHFVCNDTETGRRFMNVVVSEKNLREEYLRPFELAVSRSNPFMMMAAYNKVNGINCAENEALLRIPKDEWGWTGAITSDWFGVTDSLRSARASLDLEMPGPAAHFGRNLVPFVERGELSDTRFDDMVTRMLTVAERVSHRPAPSSLLEGRPDELRVIREAAAASFVLLKNDDQILPISGDANSRIAVIGQNATIPCLQGATFGRINPIGETVTPLAAIRAAYPNAHIDYAMGSESAADSSLVDFGARTPDGRPGVLLEWFVDDDPTAYGTEVRESSILAWFGGGPVFDGRTATRLRLTTEITTPTGGEWKFAIGGTGQALLSVDGLPFAAWAAPEAGEDIMGIVARCDTVGSITSLEPNVTVRFQADMDLGHTRVHAVTLTGHAPRRSDLLTEAAIAASSADTVFLIVGDHQGSSRESADREDMGLDSNEMELIKTITAANDRTVVVVNSSRAIDTEWSAKAAAVLIVWYSGQEMGNALAQVLTGDVAPGGRLPVTFPIAQSDLAVPRVVLDQDLNLQYDDVDPTGYRFAMSHQLKPAFAFGFGLTYTEFEWANIETRGPERQPRVSVNVTNIGQRGGREVVQVYASGTDNVAHRLVGFAAVDVGPGETREVTIDLDERWCERWSSHGWTIQAGKHKLHVGKSSEAIASVIEVNPSEMDI